MQNDKTVKKKKHLLFRLQWHVFRIEDIVAHTLVKGDEEVLFSGNCIRMVLM